MAFGRYEDGSGIEIGAVAPGMPVIRGSQFDGTEAHSLYGMDLKDQALTHISDVWAKGRLAGIRVRNSVRMKILGVTAISMDSGSSPILLDHVKDTLVSGRFIGNLGANSAGVKVRGDSVNLYVEGIASDVEYGVREETLDGYTPNYNLYMGNHPATVGKFSILGLESCYISRDHDRVIVGRDIEVMRDVKVAGGVAMTKIANVLNISYKDSYDGVDIFADATTPKYLKLWRGDVETFEAGKGLVVRTPDGTKRYRIRVDNTGAVVTELVT
jgi:hypothetical protein